MVLVYSLSHGHYSGSSFIVPNNILLIHYTNPRTTLEIQQNHAFASKFLNKVGDHLEIKKELLELEYNDNTIEITPVPAIEITEMRHPYKIERRFIGQTTYPYGKFYITHPCTEADDLLIEFSYHKDDKLAARDSIYSIPNTYMQVPDGSIIKDEIRDTRILLSTWLNELSEIYKNLYPNKVIYVIHLSCRADITHPYVTSNELAHDFENITVKEKLKDKTPFFIASAEGLKRENRFDALWNIGIPGFTHRQIYPSLFLKKSPEVYRNCDDKINEDEDNEYEVETKRRRRNSGGRRKTYRKKQKQRKTSKRYKKHK